LDFAALLVSLLAEAANAPNRVGLLPPGERERRAMLADLQTLGSIASEAEAAYLSLPRPDQGRPSGAQGAVLAGVEHGVDFGWFTSVLLACNRGFVVSLFPGMYSLQLVFSASGF
jgi:hypothetical protein